MFTEDVLVDDDPVLPDDVLASDKEITEAVELVRRDPAVCSRLMVAARYILGKMQKLKRMYEPEDLFQDALVAVLIGNRKWRTNRVDFKGLLVGIMRSLASSRENSLNTRKTIEVTLEHELPLVGENQEPLKLEEIAADPDTTDGKIIRREEEAWEESQLAILHARYEPDSLHRRILEKVTDGFESHLEIREALGIEESVYRNAWKALMRAAESLNSSAKE